MLATPTYHAFGIFMALCWLPAFGFRRRLTRALGLLDCAAFEVSSLQHLACNRLAFQPRIDVREQVRPALILHHPFARLSNCTVWLN